MTVVLAISGGVDSMVMLDILGAESAAAQIPFRRASGGYDRGRAPESRNDGHEGRGSRKVYLCNNANMVKDNLPIDDYLIAHFDHGTRSSSLDDANFVEQQATKYRLEFFTACGNLGEKVSEETARQARYEFLHQTAKEQNAEVIYTAHHLDDLAESITINLTRGTGWRGLAVLDSPKVKRPFLEPELLPKRHQDSVALTQEKCICTTSPQFTPFDRKAILRYAAKQQIPFRQDPTNAEDSYLRNRLRQKLQNFPHKLQLYQLWQTQKKLKREIDQIVQSLLPPIDEPWQRSWFFNLDDKVALELLRAGTLRAGISATRPQLENFRQAIINYNSGKSFNLPNDRLIKFSKTQFYL